jgi:peptidoglycan L-alanyl-D-glutamate endopeptidase CwlK
MILLWLQRLFTRPAKPDTSGGTTSVSSDSSAPIPAAEVKLVKAVVKPKSAPAQVQLDQRSATNIATLHPRAQAAAREFMVLATDIAAKHNLTVKIISGLRSYAEQATLYAKGRTTPGPKVTNARPGYSNHNFGTAWDIGLFKGKRYLTDSPIYTEIGQAARSLGLTWGGDFKSFKDTPHYELPTGHTLAQMRQRVAAGKDIFA